MKPKQMTEQVDGVPVTFQRLTVAQYMDLGQRAYEHERQRVIADLDAIQATTELRMDRLDKARDGADTGMHTVRYVFTLTGTYDVLGVAAQEKIDPMGVDPRRALTLACELCGIELEERKVADLGDDEDADFEDEVRPTVAGTGDVNGRSSPTSTPAVQTPNG